MAYHPGMIIAVEGINRIGKDTVIQGASTILRNEGFDIRIGSELDTQLGRALRPLLQEELEPHAAALLFAAARVQALKENRRLLAAGYTVLYNRYRWSSLVYHGYTCGVPFVQSINVLSPPQAFTVLLDADPAKIRDRTLKSHLGTKYAADPEFQRNARKGYLALAKANKDRCAVIDAVRPLDAVLTDVVNVLRKELQVNVLRKELQAWDEKKPKSSASSD